MKYEVNYEKVFTLNIGVEAKNKEEAQEKADEIICTKKHFGGRYSISETDTQINYAKRKTANQSVN